MALEQTLISPANQFLCFPRSPSKITKFPSLSQNPLFPCSLKSKPQPQFRRLRCSLSYSGGYNQTVYPKPIEIPWKKELCNSVQLIGNVGNAVEIKHLPSGKVVAWARLAVRKSPTDTSWINLTFWDEIAHVAYEHVQKGQQIAVSGRLITNTVENDDGKQQTYYKVVVQQLNFIERSIPPTSLYDRDYNNMTAGKNPGNNAPNNQNLGNNAPNNKNLGNDTPNNQKSTEELWQAFFANPTEWWDNRKNKRSPNYPDFKHKDTGEALWIEGKYNPPWVKSQLGILEMRMGSHREQDSRTHDFLHF